MRTRYETEGFESDRKRSRLDEIVEEEYPAPTLGRPLRTTQIYKNLLAIAERAFRHGVEQCSRVGLYDYHTGVQPCGWTGNHAHQDRRKGERRKKWANVYCLSPTMKFYGNHTLCVDRRSGKDRRKP